MIFFGNSLSEILIASDRALLVFAVAYNNNMVLDIQCND